MVALLTQIITYEWMNEWVHFGTYPEWFPKPTTSITLNNLSQQIQKNMANQENNYQDYQNHF